MRDKIPAWVVDLLVAAIVAGVALAVERQTQGRLWTRDILLWIGGGTFLLLRLGAVIARAGRTLGCGFVFAVGWLLPCAFVLFMMSSGEMQARVRDSIPFFVLLGFLVLLVLGITFERIRVADVARHRLPTGGEGEEPIGQLPEEGYG